MRQYPFAISTILGECKRMTTTQKSKKGCAKKAWDGWASVHENSFVKSNPYEIQGLM
jgi:hypothetical protein